MISCYAEFRHILVHFSPTEIRIGNFRVGKHADWEIPIAGSDLKSNTQETAFLQVVLHLQAFRRV